MTEAGSQPHYIPLHNDPSAPSKPKLGDSSKSDRVYLKKSGSILPACTTRQSRAAKVVKLNMACKFAVKMIMSY